MLFLTSIGIKVFLFFSVSSHFLRPIKRQVGVEKKKSQQKTKNNFGLNSFPLTVTCIRLSKADRNLEYSNSKIYVG